LGDWVIVGGLGGLSDWVMAFAFDQTITQSSNRTITQRSPNHPITKSLNHQVL
jgi:hypothetical protein